MTAPLGWFLKYILRSSLVRRYHNISTLREDVVGRHTYSMLWIVYVLTGGKPSRELLLAVLEHDMPEGVLSDVSAAYKWLEPDIIEPLESAERKVRQLIGTDQIAQLVDLNGMTMVDDKIILKLADRLEAMLFLSHEHMALGNRQAHAIYLRYRRWVMETFETFRNPGEGLLRGALNKAKEMVQEMDIAWMDNTVTEEDFIRERS